MKNDLLTGASVLSLRSSNPMRLLRDADHVISPGIYTVPGVIVGDGLRITGGVFRKMRA